MDLQPTIVWQAGSCPAEAGVSDPDHARAATVTVEDSPVTPADLYALLGRVNARPVRFTNHIALPETLLLAGCDLLASDRRLTLHFLCSRRRGVCEDGVTRHVGWNRHWRPDTGRWERRGGYPIDEDYAACVGGREVRGFDLLWQTAAGG